ncbi:MAG TPA: hypothetical protein VGH83_06285 [Candidatus Acidoferrum sp.]|jgi:hypothetical protein
MKRFVLVSLATFMLPCLGFADGHGPVFGLATPTNSKGEWSFDSGVFGRSNSFDSQASFRELIGYGITPHLTMSFTAPVVFGGASLTPTRIQSGDDFDAKLAWRFQHRATKVGARFESTVFAGLAVPGPQSEFATIARTTNAPGTMFGAVTGMASRSHYVWIGSTFTKFYEHDGDKRPDVLDYSLVYGYRPPKWRRPPDKWDWRLFGELVGERSGRFVQGGAGVADTQAHQVFVGPTALGIFRNYTVSFGAQFPIYRDVGALFPKERVRFAINFSYLLFQHSKEKP